MRRFALLLLLCVLPLQFSLAAAVDARLHADVRHHHDASHSNESSAQADTDTDAANADDSLSRLYGECGACHCCHSAAMLDTRSDFKRPTSAARIDPNGGDAHPRSAATARPERPNWLSLV